MRSDKTLLFLALGLGAYLYYTRKKTVGPSSATSGMGNPERIIDTILPWISINPRFKPIISTVAKEVIRGLRGDHIIDADWRESE